MKCSSVRIKTCLRFICSILIVCACVDNNKVKFRTVLIVDSIHTSFNKNQSLVKYMSDDGVPNVVAIEGINKIVLNARREAIEIAIQDYNTVTQHFLIRQGDSVLLTEFGDNFGIKILNRIVLPFDENYRRKYDTAFLKKDAVAVDEFYKICALINSNNFIDLANDAGLRQDLDGIRKQVFEELPKENQFIDSLATHQLISPEVAMFYKVKNTFDSIKISYYQGRSRPDRSVYTFLVVFKAVNQKSLNDTFSWNHLTFYDDWFDTYIIQLYPADKSVGLYDSLQTMIQNLNVEDSLIKETLLLKMHLKN